MDQLNQFANLLAQLASHENAARSKAEQEYTQFVSNDYKTGPYLGILFFRLQLTLSDQSPSSSSLYATSPGHEGAQ
jgi:hypothetical protein